MTWVEALIDRMPDIVNALAPGFLLLTTFSWTTSRHYGSGTTVVIISAVLSYVISQISIFYDSNSVVKTIVVYVISALLGFLFALAYKSVWFGKLLAWMGVKRTANDSIWDDVIGNAAWIAICDSKIDGYYCGQFQYQKHESGREYVAIAAYYIADSKGNVLENYTEDCTRKLMIDTASCSKFIISPKDPFKHFKLDCEKEKVN